MPDVRAGDPRRLNPEGLLRQSNGPRPPNDILKWIKPQHNPDCRRGGPCRCASGTVRIICMDSQLSPPRRSCIPQNPRSLYRPETASFGLKQRLIEERDDRFDRSRPRLAPLSIRPRHGTRPPRIIEPSGNDETFVLSSRLKLESNPPPIRCLTDPRHDITCKQNGRSVQNRQERRGPGEAGTCGRVYQRPTADLPVGNHAKPRRGTREYSGRPFTSGEVVSLSTRQDPEGRNHFRARRLISLGRCFTLVWPRLAPRGQPVSTRGGIGGALVPFESPLLLHPLYAGETR